MKLLNIKLLVIAIIMFAATSAFADLSYNFSVNTSSVSGQQGYIDINTTRALVPQVEEAHLQQIFISDVLLGTQQRQAAPLERLPSVVINNTTWVYSICN